jgi:hypothetical protein
MVRGKTTVLNFQNGISVTYARDTRALTAGLNLTVLDSSFRNVHQVPLERQQATTGVVF